MNNADFIASAIYQDTTEKQAFEFFEQLDDSQGYSAEGQYLLRRPQFSMIAGGGYYDLDTDTIIRNDFATSPKMESKTQHGNGYLYTHTRYPHPVTWTLGLSYDSFDNTALGDIKQLNHKAGMTLEITSNTTLRAAVSRTLKRSAITNQTIEPTIVAGFNQLFDDPTGSDVNQYGIALDQKFGLKFFGGIEFSKRNLDVPRDTGIPGDPLIEDWEETLYRAYLYWAPYPQWAASIEYERENFNRAEPFSPDIPDTETDRLPFILSYFHSSGLFSSLTTTYVRQQVDSINDSNSRDFVLLDAKVGYRLPKRYGILEIGINNLLDKESSFEDLALRSENDENPRFLPERTILAQIILAF